jgi:D-alanyl-D-alanine carboxypeptidase
MARVEREGSFVSGGEGLWPSLGNLRFRQPNTWALSYARVALALLLALATALAPLSEADARSRSRLRAGGTPAVASAIVVDMNGGHILYAQDPDAPRGPASLTKMMTLYVLFSYLRAGSINSDTELVVTPYAASQAPTKLGLKPGESISAADAIKALVTQSANDAAVTIAENLGGTEENFARVMTAKARSLGMTGTTFRNASGLPNPEQVTTARDMAILSQHLIRDFPEYYSVFSAKYFVYHGRNFRNHNHLLFSYRGTDGIKTGYTRASGYNLCASVHRDDKHLIAVVLGGRTGSQRDAAMRGLLDKHLPLALASTPSALALAALEKPTSPAAALVATKPAFAFASAAPGLALPSAKQSPSAPQPSVQPVARAAPQLLPVNTPAETPAPAPGRDSGGTGVGPFHVQVGAFTSEAEATSRLGEVQGRAAKVLDGHRPVTLTFLKNDTQWYRARFAGFSQDDAMSTCTKLKHMALDCVVMRAN